MAYRSRGGSLSPLGRVPVSLPPAGRRRRGSSRLDPILVLGVVVVLVLAPAALAVTHALLALARQTLARNAA